MPIGNSLAETVAGRVDRDTPPVMADQDFSDMLEERPGACIFRDGEWDRGRNRNAGPDHTE